MTGRVFQEYKVSLTFNLIHINRLFKKPHDIVKNTENIFYKIQHPLLIFKNLKLKIELSQPYKGHL